MKRCLTLLCLIPLVCSLAAAGSGPLFIQSVHADTTPQSLPFFQDWSNTNLITANDDWSGVPGIVGYRGDTSTSTTGVDPQTIIAPRTDTIDVIANQGNPSTLVTGGVAEFDGIPNPTVALQGSGTADAPFLLINISTLGQSGINVAYNLRDIDSAADNAVQAVALQYRVGTSGNFTNVPSGFVADASSGPNQNTLVTHVSVTLPGDADNQPHVQVRVITANAVGSDEWIGVDDISITSGPPPSPVFSIDKHALEFGNLLVGTTHADTLTVTNSGAAELDVTGVTSDQAAVTVLPASAAIPASGSAMFIVTFAPLTAGPVGGTLTFTHNAAGSPDHVTFDGRGVDSGFSAFPSSIAFGNLLTGTLHTDTVTVYNGGPGTLTISSASSSSNQFAVAPSSAAIPDRGSAFFLVTFGPTSQGAKAGEILFAHDGPHPLDSIGVSGTGVGGTFAVAPSTVNFGELFVGSTQTDSITVTNGGGGVLTISSVTSSDAAITVDPAGAVVPSSSSVKFAVRFSPSATGLRSSNIVFLHDGPSVHDTVKASGRGIQLYSMAAAHAAPNGTQVTIEGIMTRSMGAFMRIQDSTAGFSIRVTSGAFFDSIASGGVRAGDSVRITGITSEFNSLKQINAADFISFVRLDRDHAVPAPKLLTLAQLKAGGEPYESELVQVTGVTIVSGGDATFAAAKTYNIKDASDSSFAVTFRIPNAGDSQVDGLVIPGGPVTLTCVLGQFSSGDPAAGYQLLAVLSGDVQIEVGVHDLAALPVRFDLKTNYPNPFNPSTTIGFDVPKRSPVTIVVYTLLGQEVTRLVDGAEYAPGRYSLTFNAQSLASGVYLYRMTAGDFSAVRRMMILK